MSLRFDKTVCGDTERSGPRGFRPGGQRAFTMIEVALCLGIIAFALVAIIGVLPEGMKVQKENREETVINQDGRFFLEAIRNGNRGVDMLTNYIESISIKYRTNLVNGNFVTDNLYTNTGTIGPLNLYSGEQIIGLLSTPRFQVLTNGMPRENVVLANVRAIAGSAGEKNRTNEFAFRYQVRSEVVPYQTLSLTGEAAVLSNKLYEVRVTLDWPLYQVGSKWVTGRGHKTFATIVGGDLVTNGIVPNWFYLAPGQYTASY